MRIAFVSDAVYPYHKGGKEIRLFEIATRLAKRGHDIHIYTMKWWTGANVIQEHGVTLHGISPVYPLYTSKGKRSIKQSLLFPLYILPCLIKEDFDILDVDQMPYFPVFPSWLVSRIKRKRMIVTWHEKWGSYWFKYLGIVGLFGYLVEKCTEALSKRVIVVSQLTADRLAKKRQTLIPNGIDLEEIKAVAPSKEQYDLIYAGRLIDHKNIDLLIRVANKNNYKTLITGTGPAEKKLQKIAKNNVHFLGALKDHKEVFSYMKSSKVFVALSEREGFGISVLESLGCGTPVVTSNHKDNAGKALIKSGYNGCISLLTEADVERAIEYCMKHNAEMRAHAIASAEKYDWNAIVDKIEEVYLHE